MPIMIKNKLSQMLGERLLKISQISNTTGISRTTLTNIYYKRAKQISFETLDKLCKYLECDVGDILEFLLEEKTK